jgi:hypothetical protein
MKSRLACVAVALTLAGCHAEAERMNEERWDHLERTEARIGAWLEECQQDRDADECAREAYGLLGQPGRFPYTGSGQ